MPPTPADTDEASAGRQAVTWLRLLKLLLSIVLLALGVMEALARLGLL